MLYADVVIVNIYILILLILIIILLLLSYLITYVYSQDTNFIKRQVTGVGVEAHPLWPALIVKCQVEAQLLKSDQSAIATESKESEKIIKLTGLNHLTDCAELAQEVIKECQLIHPSKIHEIEQIIEYLKNRNIDSSTSLKSSPSSNNTIMAKVNGSEAAVANIMLVDQYIELLYEDIQDKIKGSALILQLARNPDNLIELSKNEALLSALSRVLREEWKRSIELSTNIVFTFFSFSTYNEFHSIILQYKIGSLCMDVIDYELKRFDQWKGNIEGKSSKVNTPEKADPPKSRIPEPKRRPKSGTWAVSDVNAMGKSSRSLNSSYHEDLCNMVDPTKTDEEQMKRKLKALTKRQEQLLRVAFYLLLNIADNIKVEEKMHKKNIVGLLVGALQRHSNTDLSILIVSFLLKLSVYKENKDTMISVGLIDRLPKLLDQATHSADLTNVTLRLIFNLTFDTKLRTRLVKIGLLPQLISYISDDKQISIVTKVLYHLSMDDRVKAIFAHTDCAMLVTDMLLVSRGEEGAILVALAVNLALHPRCAQLMAGSGRLTALAARAFRSTDLMLIKLVRNLSQHPENSHLFVEFVGDIANVVTANNWIDEAFVVECLGILGNILQPDLDILAIVRQYNIIEFLMKILDPENGASDEIVLGAVVVCGAVAGEEAGAAALCAGGENGAPHLLVRLLRARQEDDDLVLQVVYAFRQLLRHASSAAFLINNTEAPAYLIDLMLDKNVEIRKLCESCLDVITQTNSDWAVRIKVERFRCHNAQWLSVIEELAGAGSGGGTGENEMSDPDLPAYLSSDYLTNHNLFPSGSQMSLNATDDSDSLIDGDIDNMRAQNRSNRHQVDIDFAIMGKSSLLTKSLSSFDNDSIMATEFPLQD